MKEKTIKYYEYNCCVHCGCQVPATRDVCISCWLENK